MPRKPNKPCAHLGCPRLIPYNLKYCDVHRSAHNHDYNVHRRDSFSASFYSSKEWRKARENFLIENPFCVDCRKIGKVAKAVIVDHIIPIKEGGEPFDENNFQGLCWSCHSRKTLRERKCKSF